MSTTADTMPSDGGKSQWRWYSEKDAPAGVPIVDVADLRRKFDDPSTSANALSEFIDSCQRSGFLYIKNHGITQDEIDAFVTATKHDLDSLSAEDKKKFHYTKHQNVDVQSRGYIGPEDNNQSKVFNNDKLLTVDSVTKWAWGSSHNVAPSAEFHDRYDAYYRKAVETARYLALLLAQGLDVEDNVVQAIRDGGAYSKFLNYPDVDHGQDKDTARLHEHADLDLVTLLYQTPCDNGSICLEAMIGGTWTPLPAIRGTMVVNFGHIMQSVTNDRLHATIHRVITPKTEDTRGTARVSIPTFFIPPNDFEFRIPKSTARFQEMLGPRDTITFIEALRTAYNLYYTKPS